MLLVVTAELTAVAVVQATAMTVLLSEVMADQERCALSGELDALSLATQLRG